MSYEIIEKSAAIMANNRKKKKKNEKSKSKTYEKKEIEAKS